jgi:hypothetical protein
MTFLSGHADESPTTMPAQEPEKDISPSTVENGPPVVHTIDPEVEKRVRRKLDRNLIPLVAALYLRMSSHHEHKALTDLSPQLPSSIAPT